MWTCTTAGNLAAAAVERRRRTRLAARNALRVEREATAEADRLATELLLWAELLTASWLVLTGHVHHRGEWRKPHG